MSRDPLARLAFLLTLPHPCSYLPGRQAITLFADPAFPLTLDHYGRLIELGFRRSGAHLYRPACPSCEACQSLRVPAADFRPRRRHRRVLKRNADLEVRRLPPAFDGAHYDLYRRYIRWRHPGGGMDEADPERYMDFLTAPWCDTAFYAFHQGKRLLAVAVVDHLPQGLSAVYTFYAPEEAHRGLGTFAILWQIEEARRLNLPWVYLGYWIASSSKMAYKADFRPCEVFFQGRWRPLAL